MSGGLNDRFMAALAQSGLSPAELAPLDQFHTRDMAATVDLAATAGTVSSRQRAPKPGLPRRSATCSKVALACGRPC
jgi:hypothetical protein